MDAQTRAAALRVWEQQVRAHGDLVRAAVEALEQVHGEGEGGFEALKVALIEATARRLSRTMGENGDWADLAREAGVSVGRCTAGPLNELSTRDVSALPSNGFDRQDSEV